MRLFVYPSLLCVYSFVSVHPFVYLCISSYICLFIRERVCVCVNVFVYPSIRLYVSLYLFVCLSTYSYFHYVCLSVCQSGWNDQNKTLLLVNCQSKICLYAYVSLWIYACLSFCTSPHLLTHLFVHQCASIHGSNCMSVFTSVHLFVSLSIHPLYLHVIESTVNTRAGINRIRHFSLLFINQKLAHMPINLCGSMPIYPSVRPCISLLTCLLISVCLFMDPIVCQSVHLYVSLSIHPLCLHVIQSTVKYYGWN
jgi:hypothetical protein